MTTSYTVRLKGLINFPGASSTTKTAAEEIIRSDVDGHHCFWRAPSIHNHLSHHVLAAYDLGATASILKNIEKRRENMQRPIQLDPKDKEIVITDENWTQYVGNSNAYYGFYVFFTEAIKTSSVEGALEKYIFSDFANADPGQMIIRTMSGALHPFIHIGFGVEFGHDQLVAAGIAMAAVTTPIPRLLFSFKNPGISKENAPSLLELLRELYDNERLAPVMPYNPTFDIYDHSRNFMMSDKPPEAAKLIAKYYVDEAGGDAEFENKAEEIFWASVLVMFGSGREGRKPRLDFFLMHLVTSAIFFPSLFRVISNPTSKANLLRAFWSNIVIFMILRGRPVIKPDLLMSYTDVPRPPVQISAPPPHPKHLGNPANDEDYNPWPVLVSAGLPFPDSHHPKVMRSLLYAAEHYGHKGPGEAPGAFLASGAESHPGMAKMDGTIFVRAAGVLMDFMRWTAYGEPPLEYDWDRSGLGWDEAWDDGR